MTTSPPWRAGGRDVGIPAVVVAGLGLDARSWSRVWPLLDGPTTVLTLPALGRRPRDDDDLTVRAQAERLAALLPPDDVIVLVGHSASCQVVADVARRDGRVAGLVLVGPTTDPAVRAWPRLVAARLATVGWEHLGELRVLVPQDRRGDALGIRAHRRVQLDLVDEDLAGDGAAFGPALAQPRSQPERVGADEQQLVLGADGDVPARAPLGVVGSGGRPRPGVHNPTPPRYHRVGRDPATAARPSMGRTTPPHLVHQPGGPCREASKLSTEPQLTWKAQHPAAAARRGGEPHEVEQGDAMKHAQTITPAELDQVGSSPERWCTTAIP